MANDKSPGSLRILHRLGRARVPELTCSDELRGHGKVRARSRGDNPARATGHHHVQRDAAQRHQPQDNGIATPALARTLTCLLDQRLQLIVVWTPRWRLNAHEQT